MPGKEAPSSRPGTAGAVSTTTTTRRPLSTSTLYSRKPAVGASHVTKAGSTSQRSGTPSTLRSGATSPAAPDCAAPATQPACAMCVACCKSSADVAHALAAVLGNARALFLDDVVHHYSGDEAWLRVLRALGWSGESSTASLKGAA